MWLLDEKGTDVNGTTKYGSSALHKAKTPDMVAACWTVARIRPG